MTSDPAVSVVIPAFRVTEYIAQALDSVFAQTSEASEVIVVNDGCPDTIALDRVLEPYLDRVRYLKRENGGPAAARNTGIRAASGELIAFLDADDYWEPTFLERQMQYLRENPGVDLVYTDAFCFDAEGGVSSSLMQTSPSEGEATLHALLVGSCTVATTTVVARKSRLVTAGLFDEQIGNYSEDFDLWLRVAYSGGRIGYQRECLVHHRVHPASLTAQPLQLPRGALRVLQKARQQLDLPAAESAALDARIATINADVLAAEAKQFLLAGKYAAALDRMRASVRHVPSLKRRMVMTLLRLVPGLTRRAVARGRPGVAQNSRPVG